MTAKATSRTEERPRPLGSPDGKAQVQTQSWRPLHRHLVRVNDAAHRSRQTRFTALFHHVDVAALERAFWRLRLARDETVAAWGRPKTVLVTFSAR